MINKKQFIEIIEEYRAYEKEFDILSEFINFDHQVFEYSNKVFNRLLKVYFDEEGIGWITYFLWELPEMGEGPHVWDENKKEIPLNNLDDLWNLVKEYRI